MPINLSITRQPACVVCGEPVDRALLSRAKPGMPVCVDTSCRMVLDKQHTMPAESFKHFLAFQANIIQTRRAEQKQREHLLQEKIDTEAAEEEACWKELKSREATLRIQDPLLLKIPSGPTELIAAGEERREAHLRHLRAIIDEAFATPLTRSPAPQMTEPSQQSAALPGMLCGLCGGGCCTDGGDIAYLSPDTIRRVAAAEPGFDEESILNHYIGMLPARSMVNSCIYHTQNGCALPREYRSDVCNNYACKSFTILQERVTSKKSSNVTALVIKRRQDHWRQETLGLNNEIVDVAIVRDEEATSVGHLYHENTQENHSTNF